jgi:periplasmic divalent cation tolerance protein
MASTMFRSSQVRSLDPRRLMAEFDFVLVLTTLPGDADAASFARTLVEDRLAACVNLLPLMESVFRWEGRIDRDTERQLLIKTSRGRVDSLWERVRALHPYDVPEFVVLPIVDGNASYLKWLAESTVTS